MWCERSDNEKVAGTECTLQRAGEKMASEQTCMNFDTCSYAWHVETGIKATCTDGKMNGDEANIDCGGSCPDCMVDGGWTDYGDWSKCDAECGPGQMTAVRTCTSPVPKAGGKQCEGAAVLTKECTLKECTINFGKQCSYLPMDQPMSFTVNLEQGSVEEVVSIPVGVTKVFVRLEAKADLDIQLLVDGAEGEEAVVSFSSPYKNWGQSKSSIYGMKVQGCTDSCKADVTAVYHGDGLEHKVKGHRSFSSEYIFVDVVTVPLILKVQAYQSGVGTVTYGYDCASSCGKCTNTRSNSNIAAP